MNTKKIISNSLLILTLILLGLVSCQIIFADNQNREWLSILLVVIGVLFIKDAVRTWNGQKITWDYLNICDKFAVTASMIIQLISFLYPVKEKYDLYVILLSASSSFLITWLLLYSIGSKELRSRYLSLKSI